jgi:hypothetical protein
MFLLCHQFSEMPDLFRLLQQEVGSAGFGSAHPPADRGLSGAEIRSNRKFPPKGTVPN